MSKQLDEIAKRKEAQKQRFERDSEAREKRAGVFQSALLKYIETKFFDPIAARLRAENESILVNSERFEIPEYAGGTTAKFIRLSRSACLIVEFLVSDTGDGATLHVEASGHTTTSEYDETTIEYFIACAPTGRPISMVAESRIVTRIIDTFLEYAA